MEDEGTFDLNIVGLKDERMLELFGVGQYCGDGK